MLNAIFRAERLREADNVAEALAVLDRVSGEVDSAELRDELKDPMRRHIANARGQIEGYAKQMAPKLEMEERNQLVRDRIETDRAAGLRIEQEMADLVDRFNDLMDQQRWAEAAELARQANELDPESEIAMTLKWKANFASRIARGKAIEAAKEDGFVEAMIGVDEASIPFNDEIAFPKNWSDIKGRRGERYAGGDRPREDRGGAADHPRPAAAPCRCTSTRPR